MNTIMGDKIKELIESDNNIIADIANKGENVLPNGLTCKKIFNMSITNHAMKSIVDRVGVEKQEAKEFIRNALQKSDRIGLVVAEDGNKSIMYAYENIAIYLNHDGEDRVITVIKIDEKKFFYSMERVDGIIGEIRELHMRKYRQLVRKYNKLSKDYEYLYLESKVDLAQLDLKIYKTRSNSVRKECEERKGHINDSIELKRQELDDVENKIRLLSKAIVAINNINEVA